MIREFLADPWRVQIAMLQVRRQYPAEPEISPSASKVDKMRAVLIANRKARQQANEQKILRLLKRQPMTLRQIVETIDLSKSTTHYLVKDMALRGDIRSEKIRGVTHWRNAKCP